MQATDLDLNICHSEGILRIVSGVRVFPWAQDKIEVCTDAVHDGSISIAIAAQLGSTKWDQHGKWCDSCWQVVFFIPG